MGKISVASGTKLVIKACVLLLVLLVCGCGQDNSGNDKKDLTTNKPFSSADWENLAKKRIFFGHQSIGYNILAGIEDLLRENPGTKLNIVEMTGQQIPDGPLLIHSKVGTNGYPITKCDDFARKMESLGPGIDLAMVIVDIRRWVDVPEAFDYYRQTITKLKQKYPDTRFVHITVPLTTIPIGPKAFIKKLIGRTIDIYDDNISRNSYNELLKKEYEGKDPIFDLSLAESSDGNGGYSSFTVGGKMFFCLNPENAIDEIHLNERGRKFVAGRFLAVVARQ